MRRKLILIALLITVLISFVVGVRQQQKGRLSESCSVRSTIPVEPPNENVLATYPNTFRCTLYYSPRETGFTREQGFNMALETKPGLDDHLYSKDFLRAVEMEGFGRLKEPIDGKPFIRYWSKKWGFIEQPVDNHQRPLIPRESCAVSQPYALVKSEALLRIDSPALPLPFNHLRWRVKDTGSGVAARQLDLYWSEDDPLGPGKKVCIPKGFDHDLINPTVHVIADTH